MIEKNFATSLHEMFSQMNFGSKKIKNEKEILKKIFSTYLSASAEYENFMTNIHLKLSKYSGRIFIRYSIKSIPIDELLFPLLEESWYLALNKDKKILVNKPYFFETLKYAVGCSESYYGVMLAYITATSSSTGGGLESIKSFDFAQLSDGGNLATWQIIEPKYQFTYVSFIEKLISMSAERIIVESLPELGLEQVRTGLKIIKHFFDCMCFVGNSDPKLDKEDTIIQKNNQILHLEQSTFLYHNGDYCSRVTFSEIESQSIVNFKKCRFFLNCNFHSFQFSEESDLNRTFVNCTFKNVNFSNMNIEADFLCCQFVDCIFTDCDIGYFDCRKFPFLRLKFIDCFDVPKDKEILKGCSFENCTYFKNNS